MADVRCKSRAAWFALIALGGLELLAPGLVRAQVCDPAQEAQAARMSRPANYIFFREERDRISEPSFLGNPGAVGAQLTFTWRELEPERDRYDFAELRRRLEFLERNGKRLVIQLQENSFGPRKLVPEYLLTDSAFHGGVAQKYEGETAENPRPEGFVARRWDPAVRERFAKLLLAMGREFDGRIEAIVIPETAIGMGIASLQPSGYSHAGYALGIREMMSAARRAFERSCTIIYANFMPGEWLPAGDAGFLRSIYAHADSIGVGVGGPDVLPNRRGQRNHAYRFTIARRPGVIAGFAVQDGNLAEVDAATGLQATVDRLFKYGRDTLRLDLMFWGTEEPYYTRDVLPYLRALGARPR